MVSHNNSANKLGKKDQDHQVPASSLVLEQSSGTSLNNCSCSGNGLRDSDPLSPAQLQAAGFLAIFSCFVLVEGATRTSMQVLRVRSIGTSGNSDVFSPLALLVGALLEVIFGALGLIVAIGVLLYARINPKFIMATLFIQLLGWYTLAVFTFVNPIIGNRSYNGLSGWRSRFVLACDILGYICYCTILQGGQMFFTWKIWTYKRGNRVHHTVNFYRFWLLISVVFLFLVGLAQLCIGAVTLHELGSGRLNSSEAFIAMPYAVFYPIINVIVGIVVICGALYAMYNTFTYRQHDKYNVGKVSGMLTYFAPLMLFVWLVQLSCMGFVQASYARFPSLTAMLTGLTFLISVLPVILDAKMRTAFPRVRSSSKANNLHYNNTHNNDTHNHFVHNNNGNNTTPNYNNVNGNQNEYNINNKYDSSNNYNTRNLNNNANDGGNLHEVSNLHDSSSLHNSSDIPNSSDIHVGSNMPNSRKVHLSPNNNLSSNLHNSNNLPPQNNLSSNDSPHDFSVPLSDLPSNDLPNNNLVHKLQYT
eukprot:Awhi_evm1s7796